MNKRIEIEDVAGSASSEILRIRLFERNRRVLFVSLYKEMGRKYVRLQNSFYCGENVNFGDGVDMPFWHWETLVNRLAVYQSAAERKRPSRYELNSNLNLLLEEKFGHWFMIIQKRVVGPQSLYLCYAAIEAESAKWLSVIATAIQTAAKQ